NGDRRARGRTIQHAGTRRGRCGRRRPYAAKENTDSEAYPKARATRSLVSPLSVLLRLIVEICRIEEDRESNPFFCDFLDVQRGIILEQRNLIAAKAVFQIFPQFIQWNPLVTTSREYPNQGVLELIAEPPSKLADLHRAQPFSRTKISNKRVHLGR